MHPEHLWLFQRILFEWCVRRLSPAVFGRCLECGVEGVVSSDACNALVPCCSGYTCDFMFGEQGVCRVDRSG